MGRLQSYRRLKERCRGFRNWFRISRFVMRQLEASLARWLQPDRSGFNSMYELLMGRGDCSLPALFSGCTESFCARKFLCSGCIDVFVLVGNLQKTRNVFSCLERCIQRSL